MKIQADGRLRHRFWGDYSAVIGLEFKDTDSAKQAQFILGESWSVSSKDLCMLLWVGDSEELEQVKQVLGQYGADVKKIDSLAKSIDYGEPFMVEIPVTHPDQLKLL